ncbi:GNAT family N-acetyltransferase [Flavobacterium sp. JP2137]|uniref:GNAT family N-acetyltransferase n=1 Tax=Flavobacterium sp. JP2137 TaxID=3414510 RepID=UPI003D2FD6D9
MWTIKQEIAGNRGAFKAIEDQKTIGTLSFYWSDSRQLVLDDTLVDPDYGGRGLGKALVFAAVAFAREQGVEVVAVCPFVRAVFEKTPEIQEVWAK